MGEERAGRKSRIGKGASKHCRTNRGSSSWDWVEPKGWLERERPVNSRASERGVRMSGWEESQRQGKGRRKKKRVSVSEDGWMDRQMRIGWREKACAVKGRQSGEK